MLLMAGSVGRTAHQTPAGPPGHPRTRCRGEYHTPPPEVLPGLHLPGRGAGRVDDSVNHGATPAGCCRWGSNFIWSRPARPRSWAGEKMPRPACSARRASPLPRSRCRGWLPNGGADHPADVGQGTASSSSPRRAVVMIDDGWRQRPPAGEGATQPNAGRHECDPRRQSTTDLSLLHDSRGVRHGGYGWDRAGLDLVLPTT
jgi:hypothetical protein